MKSLLIAIILVSWIVFMWSVLLMSPKWWLWIGIGGMSGVNEYGSKKSLETTLKKVALFTSLIFVVSVVILPYTK